MCQKKHKYYDSLLQFLREDAGISQAKLARLAGVSLSTIKKLESGKRSLNKISLEMAFKFAVILQVPIEYFVDASNISLNQRFIEYYREVMNDIYKCYSKSHKKDKDYIPYSEIGDPFEILNMIYEKELENKD